METARSIPIAYDVDVAIVGGASAAVAAALEAKQAGASVFVAAPRTYLGEDLCDHWRFWLEGNGKPRDPLAADLFAEPKDAGLIARRATFQYSASQPSADLHPDTTPPSKLTDGGHGSASRDSVQYDGDVRLNLSLVEPRRLATLHCYAFQRPGDFELARLRVAVSGDGTSWRDLGPFENPHLGPDKSHEQSPLHLEIEMPDQVVSMVRIDVEKTDAASRVLLSEIVLEAADKGSPSAKPVPPTPMHVKRTLETRLLDAGIPFLFGCLPTDILVDGDGNPSGFVMANRAGRQAVRAKVVIDATARGEVARMAGAAARPWPQGFEQTFERVVVGGEPGAAEGVEVRPLPGPMYVPVEGGGPGRLVEGWRCTFRLPLAAPTQAEFARAEQKGRDLTWTPAQVRASSALFSMPPDSLHGRRALEGSWPGAESVPIEVFQPRGLAGVYVLGPVADVPREAAARLWEPLEFITVGRRLGRAAAGEAAKRIPPRAVGVPATKASEAGSALAVGDPQVREALAGLRSAEKPAEWVESRDRAVPVIGDYDVVVVGGGTGGAPAGIAAARQGARVLVVEFLDGLGGVGTMGYIGRYYYGYRGGFTAEIDKAVNPGEPGWNPELKKEWYRTELRKAGADIWFGCLGCGALVEGSRVVGAVVATPLGRGVVRAHAVVDSTGNADVATVAGAAYIYTNGTHVAVQGTGLPPAHPGAEYTNTDYTLTDETDMLDRWRTFVVGRERFANAFDLGQLIDTRERRRIVGDFVISPLDIYLGRRYPDIIARSHSNFDSHGYTVHPMFALTPPDHSGIDAWTPYRALLPAGIDGVLVTGLGISAHRDAMPILRMQPDIQNQGYAAGVAAAMAAKAGVALRDIDLEALQRHLIEVDNLPENVIGAEDTLPVSEDALRDAVSRLPEEPGGAGMVLAHPDEALPLLREAWRTLQQSETPSTEKAVVYAHALAVLGDDSGTEVLIRSVRDAEWDQGWSFKGMGQFGRSFSPVDGHIMALGFCTSAEALPAILEKARLLDADHAFSHHRAVAVACERIGDASAAQILADILRKPGIAGHELLDLDAPEHRKTPPDPDLDRNLALRELILARALYRCGDFGGLGRRTLEKYACDLRGHLSRHATAVLSGEQTQTQARIEPLTVPATAR